MKNALRFLCLALAVMLVSGAFSCPAVRAEAAEAAAAEITAETTLATFDGEEIHYHEVYDTAYGLMESDDDSVAANFDRALERLIQSRVADAKIAELGLDQFTAEEEEAFLTEAQAEWDWAVQSYVDYFLSEDTEEARAQAWKDGEAYFQALGYSVAGIADSLRYNASLDRLWEVAVKDKDLTVPEEEIRALFEEVAAMDQEQVGDSAMMYEMTKYMYGQDVWFVPEGYRGIIHILLDTDESLLNTYKDAQAAYEETEKGESFESLIAEYGTDPGMADENTLKEGYAVHRDSIYWDPVFTAAAFSDKMNQPGDTADPVVGTYGIHILHYLRDIPGGIVDLSEEIHEEISDYLKSQKENQVIVEALEAWKDGHEIVLNQDLIEAAKIQAAADQAQADQE